MRQLVTLIFTVGFLLSAAQLQAKNQLSPEVKQCQKGCGDSRTTDPTKYETCMNDCVHAKPASPAPSDPRPKH